MPRIRKVRTAQFHSTRRAKALAVAVVPLGAAVALGTSALPAAAASTCGHGGNASATACTVGTGSSFKGAFGQWHDNNMYLSNAEYAQGAHINNEFWFYTNSSRTQWVEFGLRNGPDYSPGCSPNCAGVAYRQFWAEFDSSGNEHFHTVNNLLPDGNNHAYEVLYHGGTSNQWDLYLDFNYVSTSKYQTTAAGVQQQAGLEVGASVDPNAHADTFDNYLQTYDGTTWQSWPAQDSWIDYPCGTPGNPAGYCLNGVGYHTYEWSDNKP